MDIINYFEINEYDEYTTSIDHGTQFSNLAVDKYTGRVFVGTINKLYQFSPDLNLMVIII